MKYEDYYQTLGVERDANDATIKKAYRKLARKYHPDVSTEADAEERFKALSEAYEVLKDPEKRAAYDQLGANWQAGQDFEPPPGWTGGFGMHNGGFGDAEFDLHDFSDFFASMFEGGAGPGQRSRRSYGGAARGRDVHARLFVTLEQLYAAEPVELLHNDPSTGRERRLRVTVPAGLRDGESFRLKGQGHQAAGNAQPGDLYVEMRIIPHPDFDVDGNDIYSKVPISPWEAVLGAKVPVATLGGTINLTVPAGSRTGSRLRVKDRGLPGRVRGHQYVTLSVQVPDTVSDEERKHYEALSNLSAFDPRTHA